MGISWYRVRPIPGRRICAILPVPGTSSPKHRPLYREIPTVAALPRNDSGIEGWCLCLAWPAIRSGRRCRTPYRKNRILSDPVQLVFEPLEADAAAFLAVLPGQLLVVVGQPQAGDTHGLVVFVQGHHHEVGVVDAVALAGEVFHVGVHADLHGAASHPGQLALDHHHVVLVGTVEEGQVVHRGGGHVAAAVALGHDAGHLVDPLHQDAAEEAVGTVEVGGADQIDGLHPGIVYGFIHSFHGNAPFVFFSIACPISIFKMPGGHNDGKCR